MRAWGLLVVLGVFVGCAGEAGVATERADSVPRTSAPAPRSTALGPDVSPTTEPTASASPDGIGDMLFPDLGNPGIDVQHYDVSLDYDHSTHTVNGTVAIDLLLTDTREELTLDSTGSDIEAVTVDGETVTFTRDDPELRIELPSPATAGTELAVEVVFTDEVAPEPSDSGGPLGWFVTDGGAFLLVEPDGLRAVMPCNDHPIDKATYTFHLSIDDPLTAIANGELVARTPDGATGTTTFVWEQRQPMASYLVQLLVGDYVIIDDTAPNGLPLTSVVLRADSDSIDAALAMTNEQIDYFTDVLGPYPLDRYGIAVTDSFGGLAMETQGRSMFSRDDVLGPDPPGELLAHELAHQWFGNAVTLERWVDIWLNEAFATYSSWLWNEHVGDGRVQARAERSLAARGSGSTGLPEASTLFGYNSYDGGAVVLHALRLSIGDDAFFELLRRWVAQYNGTSQGTEDFAALAEDVSGADLDDFFSTWLYATELPAEFPAGFPAGSPA